MPRASEWDETLFRRSLADLAERPPADGQALDQFMKFWMEGLDDAGASAAVTGVERDVLSLGLQAAVRALPEVTVIEHSSSAYLRVPFTTSED